MADYSWIGGAAQAATGLVGSVLNYVSQQHTNEQNYQINQDNLNFQREQTQAAWERDDTAHQREVADLKKAGLSPLASTDGLSVSSPLGAPSPIAMQAPQVDLNTLMNGINNMASLQEQKRHNLETESARNSELQLQASEVYQQAEKLQIDNKKVESEIKYYARVNELEAEKLDEIIRHQKKNEEISLSEHESHMLEIQSKMYLEDLQKQLGGESIPYYEVYDVEIYSNALKLWNVQFENFIKKIGASKKSNAAGSSTSFNNSIGVGAPISEAGTNLGVNSSGGTSKSEYKMESYDLSEQQKREWQHFVSTHKKPVFIDKKKYDRMYK